MPPRQQPRRIARELALLSLSQISGDREKLEQEQLERIVLAAIRTLTGEIQDILESASAEVKRANEKLFHSENRASNLESPKVMLTDAINLTQTAINRLGIALEFPEFIQLANQYEVREYTIELIATVQRRRKEIEETIESVLVSWQLKRLPQIDRDILCLAVAEMSFLDIPIKVAINEAVELAKRYSEEDGYRFINDVLGKVSNRLKSEQIKGQTVN